MLPFKFYLGKVKIPEANNNNISHERTTLKAAFYLSVAMATNQNEKLTQHLCAW